MSNVKKDSQSKYCNSQPNGSGSMSNGEILHGMHQLQTILFSVHLQIIATLMTEWKVGMLVSQQNRDDPINSVIMPL